MVIEYLLLWGGEDHHNLMDIGLVDCMYLYGYTYYVSWKSGTSSIEASIYGVWQEPRMAAPAISPNGAFIS